MKYKNNTSVLVVIYHELTKQILLLQRRDDPTFWQSVTGSVETGEVPYQTAIREVLEETGIDILQEGLSLFDCKKWIEFEIFPQFRYKYPPNIRHNIEHWFLLSLPDKRIPKLTEHINYQWLLAKDAVSLTKSWSNRQLIEEYLMNNVK